jgi:hypothetical protein
VSPTILVLVALLLVPAQASAPPPVPQDLSGVWEGRRKRVAVGDCRTSGPRTTTITLWNEADGSLRGRFTRTTNAPGEPDLKGKRDGPRVVFEAPRLATCGAVQRRYTVTLEGQVASEADGKRVLTMTGVDQVCPSMSCSFRDEYALTWMRAAPAPIAR